uniref:Uncharacterized protein n=1 Tax=Rhizophagus irregularis (strain DAOM 181602 / DAOM 197198 / MUCL 43194) TaxID=747089 RepID=U9UF03_RHIID
MQNAEILENFEELKKNMAETSLTNGLVIQDLENTIRNLEADVTAKERIILEKSEANNMLWEKIKALETKEENLTSQATNMEIDNKTQKKKKRPTKREKRRDQLLKLERSPTCIRQLGRRCASAKLTKRYTKRAAKFKEKFRWQAIKRLEDDVQNDDILVIKDMVTDLMSAINKSIEKFNTESGLWIKKENDYINEKGELQEVDRRYTYKKNVSRSNGFRGEWDQQGFSHVYPARSRRHNQTY